MHKYPSILRCLTVVFAASGTAQVAQAETITVDGVYAAHSGVPAEVETILIDRFEGDFGTDLEIALTNTLGNASVRGERYFQLVTPTDVARASLETAEDGTVFAAPYAPDAELRGTVRSEVIERDAEPRRDRKCVKRDEKDKCIEHEEIKVECLDLIVRIDPRLLLTGVRGEQLYSQNETRIATERFCADQDQEPSYLDMAGDLIDALALEIRYDLAPRQVRQDIRVMERRKGLRKEDRKPFHNAVKATDDDVGLACEEFETLEATNPAHVSVLFNIGLCHESAGRLEEALDYYGKALEIDPGRDYPTDGMRRVRSQIRAEEKLAQRALN